MASEILWPDEKSGPWLVTVWWRTQHGVATPVGLALRSWRENDTAHLRWRHVLPLPADNAQFPAIGSQLVKSLPIGRITDATRRRLLEDLEYEPPESSMPVVHELFADLRDATTEDRAALRGPRQGRGLGDDHYREVARVYSQAVRAGQPPTMAVADHFTVEKSTAAKKVARARERGYLPATTRGRVGHLAEDL